MIPLISKLFVPTVRSPIDSDAILAKKKGRDLGLVPRSAGQIPNMLKLMSWKPARIPKQVRLRCISVRKTIRVASDCL